MKPGDICKWLKQIATNLLLLWLCYILGRRSSQDCGNNHGNKNRPGYIIKNCEHFCIQELWGFVSEKPAPSSNKAKINKWKLGVATVQGSNGCRKRILGSWGQSNTQPESTYKRILGSWGQSNTQPESTFPSWTEAGLHFKLEKKKEHDQGVTGSAVAAGCKIAASWN